MRLFFTLLIVLCGALHSHAGHLLGGEISYSYISGNQYKVTLKIYRDCEPSNPPKANFDATAIIAVYNNSGQFIQDIRINRNTATITVLPPNTYDDPCLDDPVICVEEAIYSSTVNLPDIPGGYILTYQRCCRSAAILNIATPDDFGSTFFTTIPERAIHGPNSSPVFLERPPLAICIGQAFTFDHSAFDNDGDVLRYYLCTPLHGGAPLPGLAAPDPPAPPPYSGITWGNGFSDTNQITGTPPFTIDSITGTITGTGTSQGNYVVGVCVIEYRGGVLINTYTRDVQIAVTLCDIAPSDITDQNLSTFCNGRTEVAFTNSGDTTDTSRQYFWNFGDPETLGDTSILHSPTYTFANTGVYKISLITNPNLWCADTTYKEYLVLPPLLAEVPPIESQCFAGNEFEFEAGGVFADTTNITWVFGPNASVPSDTGQIVSGISFNDTGTFKIELYFEDFFCKHDTFGWVHVFPNPVPQFSAIDSVGCVDFNTQLVNASNATTPMEYIWSFGDGSFSREENPAHTYTNPGSYTVRLTVITDSGCIDTVSSIVPNLFRADPIPTANFFVSPLQTTIYDPVFDFTDASLDGINCAYYFANGDSSTDCNGVSYEYDMLDTGNFNVYQVVENQLGCFDTAYQTIRIAPQYSLYIPNTFTPNGDGLNERWQPTILNAQRYHLYVYSRWGDLIFQSVDQNYGWDGSATQSKTRIAPTGWYSYYIAVTTFEGRELGYSGSVRLIR